MQYEDNDYELLYLVNEENEQAKEKIYEKYAPIVEMKAKNHFSKIKDKGYELNDLIQEGMMGISNALRDYDEKKDASFSTFVSICIDRQILTFIRNINRYKHQALNDSISIDEEIKDSGRTLLDMLSDVKNPDPEESFIIFEENKELKDKMKEILTEKEKEVFDLRFEGFTYQEIAILLNMSKKAVDGTIYRIKQKIINSKETM